MPDLKTQIRAYLEDTAPPVSIEDITRTRDQLATTPSRTRRGWTVAAATAALTLIVVGGVVWLTETTSDVRPAVQVTEAARDSTPVYSIEWTQLDDSVPSLIVSDGSRLFAISEGGSPTEVFTTEDGANWRNIATIGPSAPSASSHVWDGKLVLAELVEPGQSFAISIVDAAGSVTESNVPLTIPAAHEPFVEGFEDVFARFVDNGDRLVIIGHYHLSHDRVFAAGLAGLGLTIGEVDDSGGTTIDDTTMSSGGVVIDLTLLGLDGDALNYPNPFQLISEDGVDWVQVDAPQSFEELVTINGGLAGEEKVGHGLLTSPDGSTWSSVSAPGLGDFELIPWNGKALLIDNRDDDRTVALVTANGVEPLDLSGTELARMNRNELDATDGRTLTAGEAGIAYLTGFTEGDGEHEAWSPKDIVISVDGITWTRAPLPDSVVGKVFSLTVGANGFTLVNEDQQAWFGAIIP